MGIGSRLGGDQLTSLESPLKGWNEKEVSSIDFLFMSFTSVFRAVSCSITLGGLSLIPTSAQAGSCIETTPGIVRCYGDNGSSSTTIETSPGIYRHYGTNSQGRSTNTTIIETSPGIWRY
ncbi:hypothetical protein [Prochlorococcus marinus]|uniref:hypothetical protein n=1 Tax=Prochlorococcus marinus TaxID=1219 RepID=UPI001F43F4BE|nr:hypothetical protein [Prochlorococcus marinus]